MSNKTLVFLLLFLVPFGIIFPKHCSISVKGTVEDLNTGLPLEYVTIYFEEAERGTITDDKGEFLIDHLCHGNYHMIFSHVGCESQQLFLELKSDTTLNLTMEHSVTELHRIVISAKSAPQTSQQIETISEQIILDNANDNLADQLESIAGVSSLKSGSGISKPIVHGLYGNRVTIVNNGVSQSGQQWGNDHSPEIDPLVANKIKVVKGSSALEYMGSNLGSVIIIEPSKIEKEPHLHGKFNYFFESNGIGNGVNLQLQQNNSKIAWKLNGTFKRSGDKKTPNYYLNNTGSQESNFALQLEKSFSERLKGNFYFSSFNTTIGVFKGSHIGNLTDLELALDRDVPYSTEKHFSYKIDPPKQNVNHQLLKFHTKYFINNLSSVDITAAVQLNIRKEFDVRRSNRSEIPGLNLRQYASFFETKYQKEFINNLKLNSGIQFNLIDNTNNPETKVLPLIPDYRSFEFGIYSILNKTISNHFIECGLRYDNIAQSVASISRTAPRTIVRYDNIYHNYSSTFGWSYFIKENLQTTANIGFAMRNPAINELYSNGLHQGVGGIEEGDPNLNPERSIKSTFGIKGKIKNKLSLEGLTYFQKINDYIFLNPQDEIRTTIRGTFPVFKYEQTNARIYGLDILGKYQITSSLQSKIVYSFIRGDNLKDDLPLINIPSNNILGSFSYTFPKPIKIGNRTLENLEFEVNNKYVFQQNNLLPEQDFTLPPDAYNLLNLKFSSDLQLSKTRLRLILKVDNLLNISYRDYLNSQRYFADDLGINFIMGLNLKF